MQLYRRMLSAILICLLITQSIWMAAAEPDGATFALGSGSAAPGETVDIPIMIENNPGIIGLRVFISYDADVLALQSVQNNNLFAGGSYTFGNSLSENPYKLIWADSLSRINYTDSGVFAVLTFSVKDGAAAGETPVTITCDNGSIFDTDLNGVAFGEVSGSVTVTQPAEEGGWRFSEDSTLHLIESVNEIQFVTGVDVDDPWVSSYVETTGGWRAEVEPNTHDCESTGAVLKIYDADDELVESYVIIVFGDADGNAVIDGEDVMLIKDVVNRMGNVEWMNYNDTDEFPQSFASDIDHNYTVDGQDVMMLKDSIGFYIPLNQCWETDGDSLTL